ncbi:hypothetical protein AB0365_06455 [Brevibacterium casei]|uniref:Uncharacterized protein n=1 Tax=Brevibacterium casei TaxID=33889 RepID=A0AB34XVT8_9MICO|nr:hypothetical protein [Brevibacterium casei]KZE24459.1 hypothetical protein AVW13_00005 [Brevibacterium casei]NJE66886.1 hypothetical protein [Brevibacterium sp. LS14]
MGDWTLDELDSGHHSEDLAAAGEIDNARFTGHCELNCSHDFADRVDLYRIVNNGLVAGAQPQWAYDDSILVDVKLRLLSNDPEVSHFILEST